MKTTEIKNMKNAIELLKKHEKDIEKMYDVCKSYNIPYLTPAYKLVADITKQLITDMEAVVKKGG